jgi:MerR family mercuric resistance operon transcriptional regulator
MSTFTIGTLARAASVGVETVRYYQRRGLTKEPPRPAGAGQAGGVRRYDEGDLRRLRFIKNAQTAGFTLDQIGELLALDATDDRRRARDLARARVVLLDEKIAALQAARGALSHLADLCESAESGPCPIISAFEVRTENSAQLLENGHPV